MTQTPITPTRSMKTSVARRYGPLAAVAALLTVVLVYVGVTSPIQSDTAETRSRAVTPGARTLDEITELPPGVETWARANKNGTAGSIDWGERCDTETGKLKMPLWPVPDCFAPFAGDNGGATETGVTGDSIKVVAYTPQNNDPILRLVYSQISNDDTPDKVFDTQKGLVDIMNTYYELYGRKVELIKYVATGTILDGVAARADAETIAGDIAPFAVIGGPNLSNAFADTLAQNKILCIACSPGQPPEWYEQRSPYVWGVMPDAYESLEHLAEYIGKRLAGRPAQYAGDESMHAQNRVFGSISVKPTDATAELAQRFAETLRTQYNVEFAAKTEYDSPINLATTGRDIIVKLKEAGVTTVLFNGDPLAPQSLTKIATEQGYFPEWVIGVTTLVDTSVFARTYDPQQWAHAFGPTPLFMRFPPDVAGAAYLYRWFHGGSAAAEKTIATLSGPFQVLFGALQGAGPGLTHEMFKEVLFNAPLVPSTIASAQVSFGDRGMFPHPDYSGLDDMAEIWWDTTVSGNDDIGKPGVGMYRYVENGKRHLLGQWPNEAPRLFDRSNSTPGLDRPPPEVEPKVFPPIHSGR